jgi:diguanylate cyclase (GGDEF)-like protein
MAGSNGSNTRTASGEHWTQSLPLSGKPRLVPLVSVIGAMVVLGLALALLLIGKSLSDIVDLAGDTRHQLIPEVLERQRTAINVERLGRFGEIILTTPDPQRRRTVRLSAQVLAQDSAFEKDPQVHGMVWKAYGSIRDIAALQDAQSLDAATVAAMLEQSTGMIDAAIQMQGQTGLDHDSSIVVQRLTEILLSMHDVLHQAEISSTVMEVEGLQETYGLLMTDYRENVKLLPSGNELTTYAPNHDVEQVFTIRKGALEKGKISQTLWLETRSILEELTDSLSLKAAATASNRMLEIETAAVGMVRAGSLVIIVVLVLMLLLIVLFKHYIVRPIILASKGLEQVHSGSRIEIPPARIRELDAVGEAVQRLATALHQIKDANTKLHQLTMQDGLTGIANRRYFDQSFKLEWKRADRHKRPLSVLLIDIDYFKQYNDTYGHQRGDDALKQVAATIRAGTCRAGDIAARYGGEEFVVVLPETDMQGALCIAERIQEGIAGLRIMHGPSSTVPEITVSIGIGTMVPGLENSRLRLLEQADQALLTAKREGRNSIRRCA